MNWSIHARQSVVVAILLVVFVIISGISIDLANQNVARKSTESILYSHLYSLMSSSVTDGDQLTLVGAFDPRFNNLGSGLIGVIYDDAGQILWQSTSSVTMAVPKHRRVEVLNEPMFDTVDVTDYVLRDDQSVDEQQVRYHLATYTGYIGKDKLLVTYQVAEDYRRFLVRLGQFRTALWVSLAGLSLLLLILVILAISWSLSPLRLMADEVERIKTGESERLHGSPVRELVGLTEQLNALLDSEKTRRERFKNALGDLAHSLKTPLAIMQSQSDESDHVDPDVVTKQVGRMREIVDYQLRRASAVGRETSLASIDIVELSDRLVATLAKVYRHKNVSISVDAPVNIEYPIDQGDYLEMVGNVLDNACKYGKSKVRLSIKTALHPHTQREAICVGVEDDGQGISAAARQRILQRGYRVDETRASHEGQGIGLAVVIDIIDSYNGELVIGDSALGGCHFELYLPRGESIQTTE